ncbi:hypothetical protein [Enterovirga aerilata]|uniref:Plastocyanin-like domain-containing protein n=1 Tax=Enterovirga aerilata TaxID=2730920 RepID=A0A849IAA9_9HYPH|nr:hypothetical protein [Enterovirga sp. DB1703]NNM74241.1 hypothetical protein [Enterovirga sp. DB1703]
MQPPSRRIVHAHVVALDQLLVYNRFGSFNPYGMIFALRRDVSDLSTKGARNADECARTTGTEAGIGALKPGHVRLKDCKRARPLVLRGNVGDILEITLTNLLRDNQPDLTRSWCSSPQPDAGTHPTRADERAAFAEQCRAPQEDEAGLSQEERKEGDANWPATRRVSLTIPGLEPIASAGGSIPPACIGLSAIEPGGSQTCRFRLDQEGTHLFSSLAAPAGGQGDGGSLMHGLFGSIIVEGEGALALRSQVSSTAFDAVWKRRTDEGAVRHSRRENAVYDIASTAPAAFDHRAGAFPCAAKAMPILLMARPCGRTENIGGTTYEVAELVHGDLNAIIVPDPGRELPPIPASLKGEDLRTAARLDKEARSPFREFTVVFHDELKTFYADPFKELDEYDQLSASRDGFAINYGSSGAGAIVLANRKGIGPAAGCPECLYEEFFLESWANGDPALLEHYPDDPSNVHHSYLNDKVVFRNLHAGKETHVFHLHTHQWFAGNDENRGAYLDSQTIAPQQGFTYRIYHGGHDRHGTEAAPQGARSWWEDGKGSGNRNRTPGDAIFHCHLYPHFAQGMWALWRVHDVLEDGTRVLPDGQKEPLQSISPNPKPKERRLGSVDPDGRWSGAGMAHGTPVPGLIPVPGEAAPLLPTYSTEPVTPENADGMPGYPFYVAGLAGHRAPQPPLDMARSDDGGVLDGGLPRHVVTDGLSLPSVLTAAEKEAIKTDPSGLEALRPVLVPRMLALGDMTSEYEHLKLRLLPHAGTRLERNAMGFHHDGLRPGGTFGPLPLKTALGHDVGAQTFGSYPSVWMPPLTGAPKPEAPRFGVNGAPPAPGAPYADPCGAPSTLAGTPFRRFVTYRAATENTSELRDTFEEANLTKVPDPALTDHPGRGDYRKDMEYVPDPGLIGFRRYDVSAVQFDMTVNRAGWHDPQARIAVLTSQADAWKDGRSARAEPFFFRGFSGECIELRHTNELPKDLELDDFQLRVPTDTIGQHIHLVKFDVTSADGSGNGFNYEDGTFAPDEILARICAARADDGGIDAAGSEARVAERSAECGEFKRAKEELATALTSGDSSKIAAARKRVRGAQLWWRKGSDRSNYFQTTVQRWFADPILSNTGDGRSADRTLRTVFTHDHFGPSNIQQHGYYAALLIEPSGHSVQRFAGPEQASAEVPGKVDPPASPKLGEPLSPVLVRGDGRLVGVRAVVEALSRPKPGESALPEAVHPNSREFALAIADFALLYDGRGQSREELGRELPSREGSGSDPKGLARLLSEAECWTDRDTPPPTGSDRETNERVPAREGKLCDRPSGAAAAASKMTALQKLAPDPKLADKVEDLREHTFEWRRRHGRPVARPTRPEAFSQKHHDPYLVNYRNEPLPLRIGTRDPNGTSPLPYANNPCSYSRTSSPDGALPDDELRRASQDDHGNVRHQRSDEFGEMSNAFRSFWTGARSEGHGDPCTPLIEAFARERVLLRMVQGAQEVQHTFHIEGVSFRRNIDQTFPTARNHLARLATAPRSHFERCHEHRDARDGRPRDLVGARTTAGPNATFWANFEALASRCDNLVGYTSAQEIGISEHFEVGGRFSASSPGSSDYGTDRTANFVESSGRFVNPERVLQPSTTQRSREGRPWVQDVLRNQTNTGPSLTRDTIRKQRRVDETDLRQALDYLWSFGSHDAKWNGAWGLLRIYDRPTSADLGSCLADPSRIDLCAQNRFSSVQERLRPLAKNVGGASSSGDSAAPGAAAVTAVPLAAAPLTATSQPLVCPASAPQVETIMVAARAGEILDHDRGGVPGVIRTPGMPYDSSTGIYDPDGLLIVSLPFDRLRRAVGLPTAASYFDIIDQQRLPDRRTILDLLREKYRGVTRPEPYVLKVNAGDCVNVLMINALRPSSRERGDGVRNIPGDALLPNIVPLNTDPLQTGSPGRGAWSSSRVTFTLPASLTTPRNGVPFPFGVNQAPSLFPEATAPRGDWDRCSRPGTAGCLPRHSWVTQTFFAGALSVDADELKKMFEPSWPQAQPLPAPLSGVSVRNRGAGGCGTDREFAILTVLFCAVHGATPLDFADDADGEAAQNADEVARRLADYLRPRQPSFLIAKPYAAGNLPIRVAGDILGHAAHGLLGSLVVEAEHATYPGRPVRGLGNNGEGPFQVSATTASRSGEIVDIPAIPAACPGESPCAPLVRATRLREHSLVYQDGVNLWSRYWRRHGQRGRPVEWSYDEGKDKPWDRSKPPGPQGFLGHPLGDCPAPCDDSYDQGEKAVSYRSAALARRLAGYRSAPLGLGLGHYAKDRTNLNAYEFPRNFFSAAFKPFATPTLEARPAEEVVIRVAHPSGRARQRVFVTLGTSYADMLPGFGSNHAALVAPGKAITAFLCAPRLPADFLYRDGPQHIVAGGVVGQMRVRAGSAEAALCAP